MKKTLKTVKVTFTGTIRSGTLKVYGPRGGKVSNGNGGRDPRNIRRLTVGLKSGLKVGKYTARWTHRRRRRPSLRAAPSPFKLKS